jgi:competence protein ComEC
VAALPVASLALLALGGLWLALWRGGLRLVGLVLVALGAIQGAVARPPDILIAGDASGFAVRDGARPGLVFALDKPPRFERETWLRRAGFDGKTAPLAPAGQGGALTCDAAACLYRARGHVVSLISVPGAALEDCGRAELVVALVPLGPLRCRAGTRTIGRFDLWREGGHAIWLDDDAIRIESVARQRGRRPWAPGRHARRAGKTSRSAAR